MNYGMDYQGGDAYGSGGGFENGGDAYGAASSQGGGSQGGARRNYDEQTVIPVTCRMILTVQPDESGQLKLADDRKVYHVKLVGAIRTIDDKNSTNIQYEIEDGTGKVEVKLWRDEAACTAHQEMTYALTRKDHSYVKIIGQLKQYQGRLTLIADTIRLLATGNQLTHHFLEVVYSGEKYKNTSTIVQPLSPMVGISHTNPASSGGIGFSSGSKGRTPLMAQPGANGDDLRGSLMNFIQQNGESSEYGANIEDCIKFHHKHSEADVRQAIEHLQAEGMIYSTINEDNFKAAM